jgi:hypothetical protein
MNVFRQVVEAPSSHTYIHCHIQTQAAFLKPVFLIRGGLGRVNFKVTVLSHSLYTTRMRKLTVSPFFSCFVLFCLF